jgi:mitogen-activated protein kinase 1/3
LETFKNTDRIDLKQKYPGASAEAIDFLNRVLVFNPYFRISMKDCFEHPLFAQVRDLSKEKIPAVPISFEFEKEEDLHRERLRELIL